MDSEDFKDIRGISGILIESARFIIVNSVSVMKSATTFSFMIMSGSPRMTLGIRSSNAKVSTFNFKVRKIPVIEGQSATSMSSSKSTSGLLLLLMLLFRIYNVLWISAF